MRIGWIGCGTHAAEMLLPALTRLPVTLAAVCDTDASRLAEAARRFGAAASFADAEAMFEAARLDAVGMAVGPAAHEALARRALARGLAVFVEKPPAATARGAERIAEAAARGGRPCIIGFMKRYSTANRIAANILRDPGFGPAVSLIGEYMTAPTYFERDPDYDGFFLHHCVHAMDLVPWLMGERVASVAARGFTIAPGKLALHAGFGFASGALATVVMGTHQSRGTPMEFWQVMGDHRRVEVRNVLSVRYYRAPAFKVDDPAATLDPVSDTLLWEPNLTVAANEDHKGYHALLAAFLAAARGEASDAPTIDEGVAALRVLEAMRRSLASGRTETVQA
ncbi:MAG: Gfo/Idh/MocA family oxidoreductase [Rhodospirillales bacterium]|nr:Gfo/Idh/MocA family oxidoreductase [Rhodospirillales bacterium]